MSEQRRTENLLDSQNDEEILEVDPDGNVKSRGEAESKRGGKPTILLDPRGEYLR